MKRILFLMSVCLMAASCSLNSNSKNEAGIQSQQEASSSNQHATTQDRVEVLYFHGKQRCATCMAIESNTREAMEANFSEQMKKGNVVFRSIDISKKENEKIAEKYQVTWSSLFIVKYKDGQESYENMTKFAFENARKSPDTFKSEIVKTVQNMLK